MKRRTFIHQAGLASMTIGMGSTACNLTSKTDTDILILGAGISGLNLAYQLQQAGRDFMILEGSNRIGGRLFTHPELKRDVGGRGVGDKYVELLKLIEPLEVELVDITDSFGSPSATYFEGKLYADWDGEMTNPSRLEFSRLRGAEGLKSLDGWFQRPDLDQPYSEFLKKIGHSKEEIDLINISTNYNDVYKTSAINSFHSRAFRQFNGTRRIFNFKGGAKACIEKIVAAIDRPIKTDKIVTGIRDTGNYVTVRCQDGSKYRAKKVVSTLPFTTLREVEIDANLSSNQQKLIDELPYTLITQIHLQADPFWEEDGIPASMWTDTPLERIMSMNPDLSKGELACWVNGVGTAFFDDKSDQEIADYTIQKLKEIRPSTEGRIEYVGTHKWGKYPFNKGAYCEFGVGHAALFEDMIRPAGNLHFAGEHTAKESRGIEAAAESASRVFQELNG